MSNDGWAGVQRSGVRTIVDLRNSDEIGPTTNDPNVDDTADARFIRLHRPIEDQDHEEFMTRWGNQLSHPNYYPATFEFFPEMLASAFEAIAEAPTAVLFHCSAGKDRTGLIAAIVLKLNDVTIDDIEADYELGVRGYVEWQHAHPGQGRERVLSDDDLDVAIADRRRSLREWIVEADIDDLLTSQLGLSVQHVARLGRLLAS